LRPEINKLKDIKDFTEGAIACVVRQVQILAHADRRRKVVPEELLMAMIKVAPA
jgi:hypothetical protein